MEPYQALTGRMERQAVSHDAKNNTATTLANQSSYCCGLHFCKSLNLNEKNLEIMKTVKVKEDEIKYVQQEVSSIT